MKPFWFLVLLFVLIAAPAQATDRYVDSGCTNGITTYVVATRACTGGAARSYSTRANAISVAVAGDTIFLRTGTYTDSVNCQTAVSGLTCGSGTDWTTGAILWTPYNSEVVTITGQAAGYYGSGVGYHIWDGTNTLTVDRNEAANSSCFSLSTQTGQPIPHHIRIKNLVCRETQADGIDIFKSDSMEIDNVTFIDAGNPASTLGSHGIYAADVTGHITIENSTFTNSGCLGVQFYDSVRNSANVIIRNNRFTAMPVNNNYGSGGVYLGGTNGFGPTGALVYNNLFYSPVATTTTGIWPISIARGNGNKVFNNSIYMAGSAGNHGMLIGFGGVNTQVRNNLIFNTGGTRYLNQGSGTICGSNNFDCTTAAQLFDPLFVSSTDLQLQTGSLAIGAGQTLTEFSTDFANVSRPQGVGWDEGAYEKTGSNTLTLLTPNGGTLGAAGSAQTVTWGSSGTITNVRIRYDNDGIGFASPTVLVASTPNDGSYPLTAPAAGTTYRFEVCKDDGTLCDYSNADVVITASAGGSGTYILSDNTTGTKIGTLPGVSDSILTETSADINNGSDALLRTNKYAVSNHTHSVISFDAIPQLNATATLNSATFGLWLETADIATAQTIDIFEMLRDFGESTVTWNKYDGTNAWTTPGALGSGTDRGASALAQLTSVSATGQFYTVTQTSGNLFDLVQAKIAAGLPVKLHLERNGAGNDTARRLWTSSDGTNGQRPYLEVTITTTTPTLTLTDPKSDTHWFPGQEVPIRWSSSGMSGAVTAELSYDGGTSFATPPILASHPYNQPDAVWVVAGRGCTQCQLKLSSLDNPAVYSLSPFFKISGTSLNWILP